MTNLPENSILIFSLVLNVAGLVGIIYALLKFEKAVSREKKVVERDRKEREEAIDKVDIVVRKYLDEILGTPAQKMERETQRFIEELARLMHAKSTELAAFIEKSQHEQVKESQFFVANMLSKIEKDADDYRQNKLKKVDEQIREIVQSAAREVIGRAISLSEHEDLVVKALERAKRDRVFT